MTVAEKGLPAEGAPSEAATAPKRKATSFAGDVLKLVSGTTLAQAIGVLVTPILTRMYAPEAFGTLALFTSITGIIGVVACLRYELAIMLPESDEEAANLLAVSLVAVMGITVLTIPIVTLGRPLLLRLLNAPDLGPYLWLVPIAVFFGGVFQALNYWNSRTKHFGRISISLIMQSVSAYATKLGAGLVGHLGAGPLIGATLLGSALSTGLLAQGTWRNDRLLFLNTVRQREMTDGMQRYRNFPRYSTWAALLNTMSVQLPTLLLASFFTPAAVGYYALGHRILTLPMTLIGGAIGQVFHQRAAAAAVDDTLPQVAQRTAEHLATVGLYPFLLIGLIGPELFSLLLGSNWRDAGTYAQILAPWIMCVFVASPISSLNSVLEKQRIGLLFNVVQVLTRVASLVIGRITGSITLALALFSMSGVATVGWFATYHLQRAGVNLHSLGRTLIQRMVIATAFTLPILLLKLIPPVDTAVHVGVATLCSISYYFFVVWRTPGLLSTIRKMRGSRP